MTPVTGPLRVFQVASGNVGTEMIKRIVRHPDLELVGLHCYSPEKRGHDAGEIAGVEPIGVTATVTVDEIIAAQPHCLTFHGVWPDLALYQRVLEAGINVVTTADWVTGHHRNTNHRLPDGRTESEVLQEACLRGKSTFYGTGMNPGLAQIFSIVHSADVAEIENVTCIESVDVSCHHSAPTWANCGFGRPVDDPDVPRLLELGTRVFEDGVRLMADCLDIALDEVRFSYELGACTKDVDLGWYQLPAGSVGGAAFQYVGTVGGTPRVELHLEWQMTPYTQPHWDIQGCYITKIKGDPCVYSKHLILPKPGTDFSTPESFAAIGMTVTGMPALNAIRAVVDAPPGIVTSADLPLRAFAGRFARPAGGDPLRPASPRLRSPR
jgi:4-hydroxy-tetrahydrodipicolinate reductase